MVMPSLWCKRNALAALFAATAFSANPVTAQFDAEVMQKWMTVTVIHYEVTGEFSGSAMVVRAGTNGMAEVKDRVEISLDYDQTTAKLAGEPAIKNFPTELGVLRNGAEGCTPPTLHGSYEHFTLLSLKKGLAGQLDMTAQTNYPAADMPRVCTGAAEAVPARTVKVQEDFVVPGVMLLAMPLDPSGPVTLSPDRGSLIQAAKGWTWTYTPTPVR
jgi:hypothetical protein